MFMPACGHGPAGPGIRERENGRGTHVHIVYAHPSERSFTREVLGAFLGGLDDAGHTHTVSDLYAMEFRTELTPEEYERESGYRAGARVPGDVADRQAYWRRHVRTWIGCLRAAAEGRAPGPQAAMPTAIQRAMAAPAPLRKPMGATLPRAWHRA